MSLSSLSKTLLRASKWFSNMIWRSPLHPVDIVTTKHRQLMVVWSLVRLLLRRYLAGEAQVLIYCADLERMRKVSIDKKGMKVTAQGGCKVVDLELPLQGMSVDRLAEALLIFGRARSFCSFWDN